ncbi:MAG: hypothetical protein ACKO4Y_06305 [Flavobacteriales bacterium]
MEFLQYFSIFEALILFSLISVIALILVLARKRAKRPLHDDTMLDADMDDHSEGWLRRLWNNFLNFF